MRKYSLTEHNTFPSKHLNQKQALNYILFCTTLYGCYWLEPQWSVKFRGVVYRGAFALYAAIAKAYETGVHVFDPTVYSHFTARELDKMLKGERNVSAPLIRERLKCVQEVGTILLEKFNGSFDNCILQAKGSAQDLLKIVVENFPCFEDSCDYMGKQVSFHKRARALVVDTWRLYCGKGISEFNDIDSITMFADYRVPQSLVAYGILEYSDELMSILRRNEILMKGCEYEVEIRGCSIRAVDLVVQAIREFMKQGDRKYYSECNDISVDNYLWSYRMKHSRQIKKQEIPFHKVISIH